jgi:hypothetical protein
MGQRPGRGEQVGNRKAGILYSPVVIVLSADQPGRIYEA